MKLETVDLGGPVHFADFGGQGPPMVLVHGLGGSIPNWMAVGGPLSARHRVFALDLPGFGRTPLADRAATVEANATLLGRFIDKIAGAPAIVAGNSMGGVIAAMTAAARPDAISRLILVSAAFPRPFGAPIDLRVSALFALWMTPVIGSLLLRKRRMEVPPAQAVRETLHLCGVDADKIPPEILAAMVAVAEERLNMPWATDAFVTATRSVVLAISRPRRFHAMLHAITSPTLLIQGTRDRVVSVAAAEEIARRRRDWTLAIFDGVGHIPQLEAPERWLERVHGWLADLDGEKPRPQALDALRAG
jgi:pimeloyl-ACP methyl ester carboxylesterase